MTPTTMEVIATARGGAAAIDSTIDGNKGADVVPLPLVSLEQVREYIRASKAENTIRGYQSDWRHFSAWCHLHSTTALPAAPEAVAAYIAECAEHLKVGSIQRRLNAIAEAHKAVGVESTTYDPIVANTMKGIRRTMGVAPEQKTAALTDQIRTMLSAADDGTIDARDRALLLLGFAGEFRRSELVSLDLEDCTFHEGRADCDVAEIEDGSGGRRTQGRHTLWV